MADNAQVKASYVAPGMEEALWFFGMLLVVKAGSEQTGGRFCLTEQVGRRGIATPLHRQLTDEETFLVLEGELEFFLDEEKPIVAQTGGTAYIPAGQPHAFAVISETARWLNLTTANHEAFFRAAGQPAAERTLPPDIPPDMPKVLDAAAQFGVEILGPPPGKGPELEG